MTEPTNYPDTVEGATTLLRWMAELDLNDRIRDDLAAKKVEWVIDPSVTGVWGLCRVGDRGNPPEAVVVVYTSASPNGPDFEINDDWYYGEM